MLYTEEAVRAGLRVRDGQRVFYLPEGSRLTPAARDWLRQERPPPFTARRTAHRSRKSRST